MIYCRESRDDNFLNFERIETQRDILVDYCLKKNLGKIVDIVLDNNKSGTNFERLIPIKQKIQDNQIDIFLTKDASRLGRNILESLQFISFLEKFGVELVLESEKFDEDIFPLVAWFNERRAKEDSIKIKHVLKHKMQQGTLLIKAPFGYKKQNKNLVIDDYSSKIVVEIFELFLNGFCKYQIATILNTKGYLTPSQLKNYCTKKTFFWNKQHIDRILNNIIYTGDMPYGMNQKLSYKSKKSIKTPKQNWIVIKDHHEAIISKEMFEFAQKKIKKKQSKSTKIFNKNIFSGLLYCGKCHLSLYKKSNYKGNFYICSKNNKEGSIKYHLKQGYGCDCHSIKENLLLDILTNYISNFIYYLKTFHMLFEKNISSNNKIYTNILKKIQLLKTQANNIYDDKLKFDLPDYIFVQKIQQISSQIANLENTLKISKSKPSILENLPKKNFSQNITNEILSILFKKIFVFNPYEITPDFLHKYELSQNNFDDLYKNGGIIFVQNFKSFDN